MQKQEPSSLNEQDSKIPQTSEEDLDETIVPPSNEGEEESSDSEEENLSSPSEEEQALPESQPEVKEETSGVQIGGKTYSEEELQKIIEVGSKVHEYSKEHQGFDPILLHKDYTQKSMELAEYKRKMQTQTQEATPKVQPQQSFSKKDIDEVAKEMNLDASDLKNLHKALSALGYISKDDFEQELSKREAIKSQSAYEQVKQQQISSFLSKHPEYQTGSPENDLRWGNLLNHINEFYKLPSDPAKLSTLLEKVHSDISGDKPKVDIQNVAKVLAQKKVNDLGKSTSRGGGATNSKQVPNSLKSLAKSGGLKGWSQEELDELLS